MTIFSTFFLITYSIQIFNFHIKCLEYLIFKTMHNLSWGPNNINIFLHFENKCNMRIYNRHKRKCMANLKFFFPLFILHRDCMFFFIHIVQNDILFLTMYSLSSLWKNIVVFLQFENASIITLPMTFNRNAWQSLVPLFS